MQEFQSEHSANIGWARYDEAKRVLEVDFKNKDGVHTSTYAYAEFQGSDWTEFVEAKSKGQHFAFKIRPRFVGVKVSGPPAKQPKPGLPQSGELFTGD